MTLNWNTEKVKYFTQNPDELWVKQHDGYSEYDDVNAETKSLIFGTMSVGIGNLKITNAGDFYARWKILEKHYFLSLYIWFDENNEKQTAYLTHDVVMKHIGLQTNVSYVSKKDWISRFVKSAANDKYITDKPTIKTLTKEYESLVEEFNQSF